MLYLVDVEDRMVKQFFTADCHFNHANIILYTDRPFYKKDEDNFPNSVIWKNKDIAIDCLNLMNEKLIRNWNEVVGKDDIVYHLGDFCFKGSSICKEFESKLNGKVVHIQGNHDKNNGVKTLITKAMMEFGALTILAQHHPPNIPEEIPEWCDMVLCGHVHRNWKCKVIDDIPIINVGVDVNDFRPLSIESILKMYSKIKLGRIKCQV